ncbi:alpha/beta fold hydrolase [Candidatus Giovannonibacteria bacterium]|nr:alpha/beta fold hydrolase [Candidatus Giovannonibacteria bacterium]
MAYKDFFQNRHGQKICVLVEKSLPQKGLAFVMHGLGGFKEQPLIQAVAEAFLETGFTVVRFDSANTFGESEGNYEKATVTNYYEDLEDVIEWARKQGWYLEPFVLAGHSFGGFCTAFFAENHPEKVKALAPISAMVSGKLSMETGYEKEIVSEWERTGWREEKSISKPGAIKRLPWSHVADRLRYDLLPKIANLKMPVLIVVGEKDKTTPLEHQKVLFEKIAGKKEFHVIKGAHHTFLSEKDCAELKNLFEIWIQNLN